jgi:hypothetical protein
MTRTQQIARWSTIDRPFEAAGGRRRINAQRAHARAGRRQLLRGLIRHCGMKWFRRYGQKKHLAQMFGISRATLSRDLTEIFGSRYAIRLRRSGGRPKRTENFPT